jgi:hypothetical protein
MNGSRGYDLVMLVKVSFLAFHEIVEISSAVRRKGPPGSKSRLTTTVHGCPRFANAYLGQASRAKPLLVLRQCSSRPPPKGRAALRCSASTRVLSSNAYKAVAEGADVRQTASPSTSVQMTSLVAAISPVFRGPRCIRRVHPDLLELPRVLT